MPTPTNREDLIHLGSTAIPSVKKFKRAEWGSPWYVLVDPSGDYEIDISDGTLSSDVGLIVVGAFASVGAVVFGLLLAVNASSIGPFLGLALAGAAIGCIVGGFVGSYFGGTAQRIKRSRDQAKGLVLSVRVTEGDVRPWRLCGLAVQIGKVGAWKDSTVDIERKVPSIVWAAVQRALVTEERWKDANSALAHDSLKDMAKSTLERVSRERESLDMIEDNLRKVLRAARSIDKERERVAAEIKTNRLRKIEEDKLRAKLAGDYVSIIDTSTSDMQADRSAGLAAEVDFIATLLARSDQIIDSY